VSRPSRAAALSANPSQSPNTTQPDEHTTRAVEHSFSSFTNLRDTMIATAMGMFGPGHVWLVRHRDPGSVGAGGASLKLLTTYLAGTPLSKAHYRRQTRDMNTTSPDAELPASGRLVQNGVGAFGSHAQPPSLDDRRKPLGGIDVEPLLCVSTWAHAWMYDYSIRRKREFLENWWAAIDWNKVNGVMMPSEWGTRGSSFRPGLRRAFGA
jgi:superoxide dismutase, Fe-Mn family